MRDATPKSKRRQLARSEIWLLLAVKVEEWANDIDPARIGDTPASRGLRPFEEWERDGDVDPWHSLCRTYGLTKEDLAKILSGLGDQLEARALRAGYDNSWTAVESFTGNEI